MMTNIRLIRNKRFRLLIIGLAAALMIIGFSLKSRWTINDPNDIMRNTISQKIQDNASKLSFVSLAWSTERKSFGPWSNHPEIEETHQLWLNNKNSAITSNIKTTITDPNGQKSSNQNTTFMTFDGKKFIAAEMPTGPTGKVEIGILKEPTEQFRQNNYLQTIGFQGHGGLNQISKPTEPGVENWLTEENELIKRTFHNTRTGQIGVDTYDIEKNYLLVESENYVKENVIQSRTTIQYKQVSEGFWFPVSVVTENYNIQNGELIQHTKIDVDIDKSVFNDPSAIPKDVFELKIGPNDEVKDLRSLKTRINRFLNDF